MEIRTKYIDGKPVTSISKSDKEYTLDELRNEYDIQMAKVNHPSHYTSHPSGIECIDITKHHDFCIGNAIKYLWRAGLKHEDGMDDMEKHIEDLQKAVWYINKEIESLTIK